MGICGEKIGLARKLYYSVQIIIYIGLYIVILTPCSRVLLEKLTGLQLVKEFPTFYGT